MATRQEMGEIVAAFQARERDTWRIADALLKGLGPPNGAKDGAKMAAVGEALEKVGIEVEISTISRYRSIAYNFPPRTRKGCPVRTCVSAGSPEMLDVLLARATKQRVALTFRLADEWAKAIRQAQAVETDRRRKAAEEKADAKLRKATVDRETAKDDKERARAAAKVAEADRERERAAEMPEVNPDAVKEEQVWPILSLSQITGAVAKSQRDAAEALAELTRAYPYFTQEQIGIAREAAQAAMNSWSRVVGYNPEQQYPRPAISR